MLGYKSILKKCIHEKDNLMMNYLLPMVNFTQETSLDYCVDSLDDLQILLGNANNKVIALFDNAFVKNKPCDRIHNIRWYEKGKKINQIVLRSESSFINKEMIIKRNLELTNLPSDSRSNVTNVRVKMLKTDWITQNGSLNELLTILSEAKEELYKTDLFKTLLGGFWDDLSKAIRIVCFYPFLVFFFVNVGYLTYFMNTPKSFLTDTEAIVEIIFRYTFLILQIYFLMLFLMQMYGKANKGFISIFFSGKTFLELLRLYINLTILFSYGFETSITNGTDLRRYAAIVIVISYYRLFYWLRIDPKLSLVIRVFFSSIKNVMGSFMFLFIIILMGFANSKYLINRNLEYRQESILSKKF